MEANKGGTPPRAGGAKKSALVLAVIIAATIFLICLVAGCASRSRYEHYLGGLWAGDPGFLERAGLQDMQLFIGPPERGARQGYLIMTDAGGAFIANQALEIRAGSGGWWAALKSAFGRSEAYKVSRADFEFDGTAPPMPTRLALSLSMLEGSLTLYENGKVYAFLRKDLVASAAALEAYKT